jgi:TonB family protein
MNWQSMLDFSGSANWILLTVFHSLWLSLAAFLILRLRKFRSPVVRSAWIACALILLLALPLITWSIPRISNHRQSATQPAIEKSLSMAEAPAPLLNRLMDINAPLPQARISLWKTLLNQFGFLWLAVTLICIGRLLYQLAFLKAYCSELQELHDDRIASVMRDSYPYFHFPRTPRFFVSPKLASPISTGMLAPLVILPASLYPSIGDNELRAILLHELAHIDHQDHLLGLLQRIIKALYWWNPFIYSLCNSLSAAQEEICDNYAIAGMDSAASYARLLVSLVEKSSPISCLPCTTGICTSYKSLESRIKNIVSKERDMRVKINKRMMSWILLASALLCAVVIIGSQVSVFGVGQASTSRQKMNEPPAVPASKTPTVVSYEYRLSRMLIDKVDPIYPEKALQTGVNSKVIVKINVDKEGLISDAQTTTGDPLFNDAAIAAVRQWKFHPFMVVGRKGPVSKPVPPPRPENITKLPFNLDIALDFRATKDKSSKVIISSVPGSCVPDLSLLGPKVVQPDK